MEKYTNIFESALHTGTVSHKDIVTAFHQTSSILNQIYASDIFIIVYIYIINSVNLLRSSI